MSNHVFCGWERRCSLLAMAAVWLLLIHPSWVSTAVWADDGESVMVRPIMLQIVDVATAELSEAMLPFNTRPGTTVTLLLRAPAGERIVAIDESSSEIASFADDLGTNLLESGRDANGTRAVESAAATQGEDDTEAPDDEQHPYLKTPWMTAAALDGPISSFPRIGADGARATVEIVSPRVPSAGSSALELRGRIGLELATGSSIHSVGPVAIKVGEGFDVSGREFEIIEVRSTRWADYRLDVTMRMSRDTFRRLARMEFADEAGDIIESSRFSHMEMGEVATVQYGLKREVEAATLEFELYEELRNVGAEIDLTVTLGLRNDGGGAR